MYKKTKLIWIFLVFLFLGATFLQINYAQSKTAAPEIMWSKFLPSFSAGSGTGTAMLEESWLLKVMLPNVLEWFLGFLAMSAIVIIMLGGYMYLTSLGSDQAGKGKETILYGVVGLLIVILSYAIVSIVQNFDFFI